MRFDEPNEDQDFETVSKNETDVHVHINRYPTDETDFPQNPFSDRQTVNSSLFFNDGEKSVDFVLVWKKILPREDIDEVLKAKELRDINKKEKERAERREIFEENLLQEGLKLESYVIDDEINFTKLHAPVEVLKRYAEILKLRLPMREVSDNRFFFFPK